MDGGGVAGSRRGRIGGVDQVLVETGQGGGGAVGGKVGAGGDRGVLAWRLGALSHGVAVGGGGGGVLSVHRGLVANGVADAATRGVEGGQGRGDGHG